MRIPSIIAPLFLACGSTEAVEPRGEDQDANPVLQVGIGDELVLQGKFVEGGDPVAQSYGRTLTANYQLVLANKAALHLSSEQTTSFCVTGAEVIGPFFTLQGEGDLLRSTDEHRYEGLTAKEDFPGILDAGSYRLSLSSYSQGECQYSYSTVIQTRSDVSVLEPGEWDPTLTGKWKFTGWEGDALAWTFGSEDVLYQRFDHKNKLISHIQYISQIDGSVIPGQIELTVKRVHRLADTEPKQNVGDKLHCIYRVFPGYEGSPSLWWTCSSTGDYPDAFDYPLKEFAKQDSDR